MNFQDVKCIYIKSDTEDMVHAEMQMQYNSSQIAEVWLLIFRLYDGAKALHI